VVGILAFKLIGAFNNRGVKLLKKIRKEIAFVIFREQIENITGKQQSHLQYCTNIDQ